MKVIYNGGMKNQHKKPGPKCEWDESLGPVKEVGRSYPAPVCDLLKEQMVKRLLNRMAIDPEFKVQVLGMVGEV